MSKKENEACSKILKYLEQQNRPYSVNDIFLNLHKEFGKTAVQKALDSLVESGSVKEKTYGKQKVYVADQDRFPPLDEENLKQMDVKINQMNEELKNYAKSTQEADNKLKNLSSSLTTEEALKRIKESEVEITHLEEKLSSLRSNQVIISEPERERIMQDYIKAVKEWRKRRRIGKDMTDAILEGYPKGKKDLFEEIGIETDEDVGVIVPTL